MAGVSLCRSHQMLPLWFFLVQSVSSLSLQGRPSPSVNLAATTAAAAASAPPTSAFVPMPSRPNGCCGNRHKQAPTENQCARLSGRHPCLCNKDARCRRKSLDQNENMQRVFGSEAYFSFFLKMSVKLNAQTCDTGLSYKPWLRPAVGRFLMQLPFTYLK